MNALRLPGNWNTFSLHQKLSYLVNTNQARDYAAAGVLLNKQKELIKEKTRKIKLEAITNARLPYADNQDQLGFSDQNCWDDHKDI